jgi:hypothetical protein
VSPLYCVSSVFLFLHLFYFVAPRSCFSNIPTKPVLPRDTALATIGARYCSGLDFMSGTVVSISAIDALAHLCIAAMIVRMYGSLATQQISGGQLLVLERVVVGSERFIWGLTLHAWMIV